MRQFLVRLHRWFGLSAAVFLFIAGFTGAIISWDHELDEQLNPALYRSVEHGAGMPALELVRRIEEDDPRVRVRYFPLVTEPGHAFTAFVEPRVNPSTGKLYEPGYNQIALNPDTGEIQGKRMWGEISLSRENLLPFLYKLHYSMHVPAIGGTEWGVLLMGIIALGWVADSFISLWISFPSLSSWRKSLTLRWRRGGYRLLFDIHRSGGVWLWMLLLILAVTSVSMNLEHQVVRPLVSKLSPLSASPFASRTPTSLEKVSDPHISYTEITQRAAKDGAARGLHTPPGSVFLSSEFNVYGVGFHSADNSHGDGSLGVPWLYYDASTGQPAGATIPGEGSFGDVFMQAQFPLHSGRILGLPGRIAISLLGAMVAVFSATGVVIWARKRRAVMKAKELIPASASNAAQQTRYAEQKRKARAV